METTEQILSRQCAELNFKNGRVEYFSISTQWGSANTVEEAILNILDADVKYNGLSPLYRSYDSYSKPFLYSKNISDEEFKSFIDAWNSLGFVYTLPKDDIEFIENKN